MGIFRQNKQKVIHQNYSPVTEQEAWIGILFSCTHADTYESEVEQDALLKILTYSSKFDNDLIVEDYKEVLSAREEQFMPLKDIVSRCVSAISIEDHGTLLAMCMELVLADGRYEVEEKKMIDFIVSEMNMDAELAERIIEVQIIRYKYNYRF